MASGPIASWQIDGKKAKTVLYFTFLSSKVIADSDCSHEIKRCLLLGRKAMSLSSSHVVWMWELDHKEGWVPKNWYFWTVVSEKTLKSPLEGKEIKPVHPKGNQPWIFIGRTFAEALILWPLDANSWLIGKVPDSGKDWGQEENGVTEDEMIGWHHWYNGHEFEQNQGDGEGQGRLVCCIPLGRKESDSTYPLNNNNK